MRFMLMKFALKCLFLASLSAWLAQVAWAQLPKRDLMVELREVSEAQEGGYVLGTQPEKALLPAQQVLVRNGEKASVRQMTAQAMQWVQSATTQNAALAVPGAAASSSGGSVNQALTWMEAGQGMTVKPRWPGGRQWVTVEIEVQSASVTPRLGADLPEQMRSQIVTTVTAPMGQWVTIAASGSSVQRGSYGTESATETRRLLQIRVLAP